MRTYFQETRRTAALALPMFLGFAGQMGIFLIDGLMLGRIGVDAAAGYAYGAQLASVLMVAGFGLCTAQHVLGAAAAQRGDGEEARQTLAAGLAVAGGYGLFCAFAGISALPLLHLLGQDPRIVPAAQDYLFWAALGVLPSMCQQNLKNLCEARGLPWAALGVLVVGLAANALFNWLLIYGAGPFPRLEVGGAGLATVLARLVMLTGLAWFVLGTDRVLPRLEGAFSWWNGQVVRRFLRIGLPSGGQSLLEHLMFVIVAVWMGWLSAETLAAYNHTFRYGSFVFMVPLGLSFATSIRVSQAHARGDLAAIRRVAGSSVVSAGLIVALAGVVMILSREALAWSYFDEVNERTTEVVRLTQQFIFVMALLQFVDAMQFVLTGALRGLGDAQAPMRIAFVSSWGVGLVLAWILGFELEWGGVGLWVGMMSGFIVAGILLSRRLLGHLARLGAEKKFDF